MEIPPTPWAETRPDIAGMAVREVKEPERPVVAAVTLCVQPSRRVVGMTPPCAVETTVCGSTAFMTVAASDAEGFCEWVESRGCSWSEHESHTG